MAHNPTKQIMGLIGYPLAHSWSPSYFARKFEREGIADWEYKAFPLASIQELPELIRSQPTLRAFNVTIPYKTAIIPYLNALDPAATQIGAVNTVLINQQGQLSGYNTDVIGFELELLRWLPAQKIPALILGNGGASKAVQFVLQKLDWPFRIVTRVRSDQTLSYQDIDNQIATEYRLWINTTPLGMWPEVFEFPSMPYAFLSDRYYLYDLVYNPAATTFLNLGFRQGAKCLAGLGMLEQQAEAAWRLVYTQ